MDRDIERIREQFQSIVNDRLAAVKLTPDDDTATVQAACDQIESEINDHLAAEGIAEFLPPVKLVVTAPGVIDLDFRK